jgi:hypothetical protein
MVIKYSMLHSKRLSIILIFLLLEMTTIGFVKYTNVRLCTDQEWQTFWMWLATMYPNNNSITQATRCHMVVQQWRTNRKNYEREWVWHHLRYYPITCLEGLRKWKTSFRIGDVTTETVHVQLPNKVTSITTSATLLVLFSINAESWKSLR